MIFSVLMDTHTHTQRQCVATGAQVFCNCIKSTVSKLPKTPEQAGFFFVYRSKPSLNQKHQLGMINIHDPSCWCSGTVLIPAVEDCIPYLPVLTVCLCHRSGCCLGFVCTEAQPGHDIRHFQTSENSSHKSYKPSVTLAFPDCFGLSSILFVIQRAWMLLCAAAGPIQHQEVTEDVVLQPSCASLDYYNRRDCIPSFVCPSPAAQSSSSLWEDSIFIPLAPGQDMPHINAAAVQWSVTDRRHSSQNQTPETVLSYREFFAIKFCDSVTCPAALN